MMGSNVKVSKAYLYPKPVDLRLAGPDQHLQVGFMARLRLMRALSRHHLWSSGLFPDSLRNPISRHANPLSAFA